MDVRERVIRRRELRTMVGLSDSQVLRMEKAGIFPARRQISPGIIGWLESEIVDYLRSRPAVKS